MQFAPPTVYPLIGLLLSAGAPIGSFLIRFHAMPSVRDHPLGDLHAHAFFYLYELVNQALIQVADALRASKRAADVAARWGGDEFAILLEGADQAAALRIAEGVMGHLREGPSRLERGTVSVTIGICVMARPSLSFDLFAAADRALLAGKARGRNRIEMVSIGSFVSPRA